MKIQTKVEATIVLSGKEIIELATWMNRHDAAGDAGAARDLNFSSPTAERLLLLLRDIVESEVQS